MRICSWGIGRKDEQKNPVSTLRISTLREDIANETAGETAQNNGIANVERGSLQDYIGKKALNPFINKDKILQETIRFSIPGTQFEGIGITAQRIDRNASQRSAPMR